MKKICAILAVVFLFLNVVYGQTVNGVDLKSLDVEYVQIVGTSQLLSTKVSIDLDFGQRNKLFNIKDTQLRDEFDKPLVLNSMIDALNFMSKNGYEFVQAYVITVGNQNVYHYLMRKRKP